MISFVAFFLAAFVFVWVFDRLRRINWRTAKLLPMFLLLSYACLSLWIVHRFFTGGARWYELVAIVAVTSRLLYTQEGWRHENVPVHVTRPGEAPTPELSRFR